ncbi:SPFH domain-containing protein [Nonomuraea indica]|uniref:SPFH domain-containing protein n=1 Tax=Nonomuraea indica TaxID=1581193 RepID=UPI000C7E0051|nr:SPFH domain-containing protein [Nonomuraea indica]
MNRKTAVASLAAALLVTGCSVTIPEPDQKGIVYDAGMFSDTTFQNCVDPGVRDVSGWGDKGYVYPAGQRTFEFAADPNDPSGDRTKPGAEAGPLTMWTKDPLEMRVSGVVTFSLTGDCQTLRRFHEQIGLKYEADTDAGWDKLLSVYIGQPLDRALDAASKEFAWRDLTYVNPQAKQQWETKVAEYMGQFLREQGGTAFFEKFSVTLQQPQPPLKVREAMAAVQQAQEENTAQKAKNEKARTELEAIKALKDVLGAQGAVMWQAVKDGRIQIIVSDSGQINVTPNRGGGN